MSRTKPVFSFIAFTILLSAILMVAPVPAVYAASITVNSTCSLADAITTANTDRAKGGCPAGSGADTITLSANITLDAALPYIRSDITIEGGGYAISGNNSYRIFRITSRGNLTLNNVTLTNGNNLHEGGAILSYDGTLTITNSTLSNNSVSRQGGAIYSSHHSTVTISNSTFSGNSANWGGAILNQVLRTLNVSNSTFRDNSARMGGAIASSSSPITGDDTITVTGN